MKFAMNLVQTQFHSPLGPITLAATDNGLAGLWFDGQRHLPEQLGAAAGWPTRDTHPVLNQAAAQLREYFAGTRHQFDLPLDLDCGTPFQRSVWHALLGIGHGETASYRDIAARVGNPSAVRAVGAAVGRNPVSIVVPCHRVVGADGSLTGYAGGLARKTALLELEGALQHQGLQEVLL